MRLEPTITDDEARELLDEDAVSPPDHDAWIAQEIEARMAEKRAGHLTYRSLDDVMADFGFDAR